MQRGTRCSTSWMPWSHNGDCAHCRGSFPFTLPAGGHARWVDLSCSTNLSAFIEHSISNISCDSGVLLGLDYWLCHVTHEMAGMSNAGQCSRAETAVYKLTRAAVRWVISFRTRASNLLLGHLQVVIPSRPHCIHSPKSAKTSDKVVQT